MVIKRGAVVRNEPQWFTDEDLKDGMKVEKDLMQMDTVTLRALIRQSSHRVDNRTQRYILAPEETMARISNAVSVLRIALRIWERKAHDINKPDIKYAHDALRRGEESQKALTYHPSPPHAPFGESDLKALERAIIERRSVRRFSDRDVPDDLLDKVLQAAIWAPCSCSLQGCRFIVLRETEKKKLILQPWAAPVMIIAAADRRPYQFLPAGTSSPYLDLGAALQNMMLMAHALGLATTVASFSGEKDLLKRKLGVPDYIEMVKYVALGWPDDEPTTVPRMELKEVVSREEWQVS
jgi:nitroreductase